MSTETAIEGQELDSEEEVWLRPYNWDLKDVAQLSGEDRKLLFMRIWNRNEPSVSCDTCGAREGYCIEAECIRLRVTHKLGLQRNWKD